MGLMQYIQDKLIPKSATANENNRLEEIATVLEITAELAEARAKLKRRIKSAKKRIKEAKTSLWS